jgi:hypothetical protein
MSYKTEVIADGSGKWTGNSLRFASEDEAQCYVFDLAARWTSVRDTRVTEDEGPVTHSWTRHGLVRVEA